MIYCTRLTSLNWFFKQWVYQADLPSYQLEYNSEVQPNGKVLMTGNVIQENAPADWFMVLPVAVTFGKQIGYTTVKAYGPSAHFAIGLPSRPGKVELDPRRWVLSEKTSTKGG